MTDPTLTPLQLLGKYEILATAGEGAMGAVYRARDTVLNRTVAIKVMNATIARDQGLRERFLREAQSAGSLQHPNVVTIHDFGETDGHLFIAMEFVEGTDLETALAAETPLPLTKKLDVIAETLQGLAYAHQRGIVHRDLKPANIRITTEGHAKLMDFGVAHLTSQKMTATGMVMGTPYYLAPEGLGGQPVSAVSDIFSMGAVLYEVLTGVRPFTGESMQALFFAIIQKEPPPPSSLVPGLPAGLDQIVARALAKEPEARFPSAMAMAEALIDVRAAVSSGGMRAPTPTGTMAVPQVPTPSQGTPTPVMRVERVRRVDDLELAPKRTSGLVKLIAVLAIAVGGYVVFIMRRDGSTLGTAIDKAARNGTKTISKVQSQVKSQIRSKK